MYLPKLRELKEALTSFFTAPYTTKFPGEAYQPEKEFRGFPEFDEPYCVGCGACAQVCPTEAITISDDLEKGIRTLTVDYASCIHCGQCNEHCITEHGINPGSTYALPVSELKAPEMFESVEKELLVCECCGSAIGCRDHLQWIRERLGARAYAHPNLMLNTQEAFFGLDPSAPKEVLRREDQFKFVCPPCRQRIVVKDEF